MRAGYEKTLLIFVKAPREVLGKAVYNSRYTISGLKCWNTTLTVWYRIKDWLYGITQTHPGGSKGTIAEGEYEAEDLLSVYHLVNWTKENGGAGVTPELGPWENVKSIFPLHNEPANQALLKHLSRKLILTNHDLDRIRDLFGSKVRLGS